MATTPTAYDAVAYPGGPFAQTHPDRLATLATLYGLNPAPPGRCRVLELGCGEGGNLVPMGYALRDSEFLGIDLAETAVEKGRGTIAALGLRNVELVVADVSTLSNLGSFDYVIAHGLYSWVSPAVQERILGLAREVLPPHGVAYVSYNAYPGNHATDAVRQMMKFHVRGIEEPALKIERARALVRQLARAALPHPVLSAILADALAIHEGLDDAVLFHDQIAGESESLLFSEFVGRAETHGLQFLSEARYPDMMVWNDEPAGRLIQELAGDNLVLRQQYRDFLSFRKFRQTLLCRDDAVLTRPEQPDRLRRLGVAARVRPERADADVAADAPLSFVSPDASKFTTMHPLTKAAFLVLAEVWPLWLPWERLLALSRERLAAAGEPLARPRDEERLLGSLLEAAALSAAELHSGPPPFVTELSGRPRVSRLARREAAEKTYVTSLNHRWIALEDELVRQLVVLLDGTHDRTAIEREMTEFVRERNEPGSDALLAGLTTAIDRNLDRVAKLALLEA